MQLSSFVALLTASVVACDDHTARKSLGHHFGLDKRQYTSYCSGPGHTCASQCGSGWEICSSYPNCCNPSEGQTCCEGGSYCEKGYYCASGGCCPNNDSLEQCGASSKVPTLAGGSAGVPSSTSFQLAASSSSMTGEAGRGTGANAALGAMALLVPFI